MESTNGWHQFLELAAASVKCNNFDALMQVLLTAEEKDQLSTRVLLIQQLLSGKKSQREIAQELKISISKITRGSNELKRSDAAMVTFLKERLLIAEGQD